MSTCLKQRQVVLVQTSDSHLPDNSLYNIYEICRRVFVRKITYPPLSQSFKCPGHMWEKGIHKLTHEHTFHMLKIVGLALISVHNWSRYRVVPIITLRPMVTIVCRSVTLRPICRTSWAYSAFKKLVSNGSTEIFKRDSTGVCLQECEPLLISLLVIGGPAHKPT